MKHAIFLSSGTGNEGISWQTRKSLTFKGIGVILVQLPGVHF